MSMPYPEVLLRCAVNAARAAGDYAVSQYSRRNEVVRTYSHDAKLALDAECQTQAEQAIRSEFPGHRVLGEESAAGKRDFGLGIGFECPVRCTAPGEEDVLWIIDPIDGTVNFMHGMPLWCCSVAVAMNGQVVAGAVYAPALDRCYTAHAGGTAACNDRPLRVSGVSRVADAMIATGIDRDVSPDLPPFELFRSIALVAQKGRILGSAALDLCYVADGMMDGYVEAGIFVWDIAAAGLIVQQAGGKVELLRRLPDDRLCFLASNGSIHAELRNLIPPSLRAPAS